MKMAKIKSKAWSHTHICTYICDQFIHEWSSLLLYERMRRMLRDVNGQQRKIHGSFPAWRFVLILSRLYPPILHRSTWTKWVLFRTKKIRHYLSASPMYFVTFPKTTSPLCFVTPSFLGPERITRSGWNARSHNSLRENGKSVIRKANHTVFLFHSLYCICIFEGKIYTG